MTDNAKNQMTGADMVVRALQEQGVEHIWLSRRGGVADL